MENAIVKMIPDPTKTGRRYRLTRPDRRIKKVTTAPNRAKKTEKMVWPASCHPFPVRTKRSTAVTAVAMSATFREGRPRGVSGLFWFLLLSLGNNSQDGHVPGELIQKFAGSVD